MATLFRKKTTDIYIIAFLPKSKRKASKISLCKTSLIRENCLQMLIFEKSIRTTKRTSFPSFQSIHMILKKEIIFLQGLRILNGVRTMIWKEILNGKKALAIFPRDHILHCDETSWQVFHNSLKAWAEKGSQKVKLKIISLPQ